MPSWKKVILSGSNAALNSLNVTTAFTASGLNYPTSDNGEESFLQTNGSGNLSFQYVKTIYEEVYNGEATTIVKGTPVYVSGSVGAASVIFRADAGNPTKMPVIYISADNIASGATGRGIALGLITGVNTTGYPAGTEIYIAVGGGWTSTRPTGSAIVQTLGYITKEGNGGQGVILNPGPNSLPNLPSGSVWVGNSNSIPVAVTTSSLSVASASFASTASFLNSTTNAFIQNGNSFGTQALLGTNDNQNLALETSGSIRMFISSSGNIGINKVNPNATLDVNGNTIITGSTILNGLQTFQGTTASDTAPLGSELLNTGTGDASWTGVNFATGYTHVTGSITALTSSLAGVVSTFYQIAYTITGRTAGSVTIAFGGQSIAGVTATGTFSPRATTTDTLTITPTTDFDGTIVLSIRTISNSSPTTIFRDSNGVNRIEIRATTAINNTIVGNTAGQKLTTGINNSFFGTSAGSSNTIGGGNSFFGSGAGASNTTAALNSFFGQSAGTSNTTGVNNTAIGASSLSTNTTGNSNTAVGLQALRDNTTAGNNTAIGSTALRNNTTGGQNTAIGTSALRGNTTGASNTAIGYQALLSNTTGASNTAIGLNALFANTTGASNTAVGFQALVNNTTANNNTAIGLEALRFTTTGASNTAIGANALRNNTTGASNISIGLNALRNNTTGAGNTAIGVSALESNTTGANNTAIGFQALLANTTGGENTAIGLNTLLNNTTGASNTAIGLDAGRRISNGANLTISNNSVFLGQDTRALNDNETNQIVIGHTAIGLGSNTVVLGNSSIVTTALRGSVGIGTTSPNATLDVSGSAIISGSFTVTPGTIREFQVNTTGVSIGNLITDTHTVTGSLSTSGSLTVNGNTIITGSLAVSQSLLQYSNITAVTSGSTSNVASFSTGSYTAAFFDYVTTSGTNARAGTVFTVWNGNSVEYAETSTNDIGSTSNLLLSASLSAGAIRLQATSLSGSWSVKTLARML